MARFSQNPYPLSRDSYQEKEALENIIVGEATGLFHSLKAQEGNRITTASVSTNTTGSVNLLAPVEA